MTTATSASPEFPNPGLRTLVGWLAESGAAAIRARHATS
jgi:hypothetical protein